MKGINNTSYSFYSTDCTDRSVISNGSVPGSVIFLHGSHGSVGARAVKQERQELYTETFLSDAKFKRIKGSEQPQATYASPHRAGPQKKGRSKLTTQVCSSDARGDGVLHAGAKYPQQPSHFLASCVDASAQHDKTLVPDCTKKPDKHVLVWFD